MAPKSLGPRTAVGLRGAGRGGSGQSVPADHFANLAGKEKRAPLRVEARKPEAKQWLENRERSDAEFRGSGAGERGRGATSFCLHERKC